MKENYIVKKSNYFIMNSSYDLSLEEQKVILILASMVQPTDDEFRTYKFRIADFLELLGIEDQSKYTEIPKITKGLMRKVLEIQEGDSLLQVAWLNSARYEKGSGEVILRFSPDLKPYMLQLKENFTQYQLGNVLNMKSKYSPRVYELLKANKFKKQGYIEIEITELRRLLRAEDIYPLYGDFKRFIIKKAQKELKKVSDISFEFQEIKTGRKVTSIKFYIKSNKASDMKAIEEISATSVEDAEKDDLIEKLLSYKIAYKQVKKLVEGYSQERIQRNIEYALKEKSTKNNFAGFVVKAIEDDYAANNNSSPGKNKLDLDHNYDIDELEKKLLKR